MPEENESSCSSSLEKEEESELESDAESSYEKPQVLIVDDQAFQLEALTTILETLGLVSDVALGGDEALRLVNQRFEDIKENPDLKQYQLIFMDYSMPDKDGIETATEIFDTFKEFGIDSEHADWPYMCCLSAYTDETF